MERIYSLDYLRGVMALSVMLYHYSSWAGIDVESDTILGRLGIYAVSTFYILSGLSLAHVYKGKILNRRDILSFLLKRFARIVPLFWFAIFLVLSISIGKQVLSENHSLDLDYSKLLLNITLLFGFFSPEDYIVTGGWSIGNEMVFYTLFPVLVISFNNKFYFYSILSFLLLLSFIFNLSSIDPSSTLKDNWTYYVNPINQVPYFLVGCLIGFYEGRIKASAIKVWSILALISILIFCFYPVEGDKVKLTYGLNKYFFMVAIGIISIYIMLKIKRFNRFFHGCFLFLGNSCYSIYLLHPIVATIIIFAIENKMGIELAYILSFIATLFVSYFSYRYLEKPGIALGKKLVESIFK